MIACDFCDEWYHAACLGIADEAVELIDQFVCPECEKSTSSCSPEMDARTSYKVACKADGCSRAARLPMSRYCSEACGMRTVKARADRVRPPHAEFQAEIVQRADARRGVVVWTRPALASIDDASLDAWFDSVQKGMAVPSAVPPVPPGTSSGQHALAHATALPARRDASLARELARVRTLAAQGNTMIDVLAVRAKLLQLAEDRVSTLPLADDDGKREAGPRCGFDARLAWPDEALWQWATSPAGRAMLQEETPLDGALAGDAHGAALVCGTAKRRCKRHADWSIVRGAEAEVARELQTSYVSALAEREQHVRALLEHTPTT